MAFTKAVKSQSKLRMAIAGPSGSGKTFTALQIARGIVGPKGRIAMIETERKSAFKYAGKFDFDAEVLTSFHPRKYIEAIEMADREGYDALIIDSLSHAWFGTDGALDQVEKARKKGGGGNSFTAWRDVTPLHNKLVDAILSSKCHVICTLRTKVEYVIEKDEKGRSVPRKVGMQIIQREGMDYEFDVVGDMDLEHNFMVSKTRCDLIDEYVENKPGEELGKLLINWLNDGEQPQEPKAAFKKASPPPEDEQSGEQEEEPEGGNDKAPQCEGEPSEGGMTWYLHPENACDGVKELVGKIEPVLTGLDSNATDTTFEMARYYCCQKFGVNSMDLIPEDEVENLKAYMRKGLIQQLRYQGVLAPPRRRAA